MTSNEARTRVNGGMLPAFINRSVCLIGSVTEVEPSGMAFKVKASDGKIVTVQKREPNQDYLEGIVEIQGKVMSESSITCNSIIIFPSEYTQGFDMDLYNEAVTLTQKNP